VKSDGIELSGVFALVVFDIVKLYVVILDIVEFPVVGSQFGASKTGACKFVAFQFGASKTDGCNFVAFQFGVFHAANAVCINDVQISIPINKNTTFSPVFLLIFPTPISNDVD